jgi:uncharacterized protein YdhG (YjbR/CyaY superfamily)
MPKDPSREAHFPAIEKRYGEKMAYWFKVMKEVKDLKYPEQIAHLRENYGFSQAHANALVMYSRGSTSSKRHGTHADFFKTIKPEQVKTMKKIFKVIKDKYPKVEPVIAWNQPMLKLGDDYIFGISASTNHMSMAFWSDDVLDAFREKLAPHLRVTKKTIAIPNDWVVEEKLILAMAKARIAETK